MYALDKSCHCIRTKIYSKNYSSPWLLVLFRRVKVAGSLEGCVWDSLTGLFHFSGKSLTFTLSICGLKKNGEWFLPKDYEILNPLNLIM